MQQIPRAKKPSGRGLLGKQWRAGRMLLAFGGWQRLLRLFAVVCWDRLLRLWALMFAVACVLIAVRMAFAVAGVHLQGLGIKGFLLLGR